MNLKRDFICFITIYFVLFCVAIGFLVLPDYDWFNYHFYDSWAFLTDRITTDFFAGNFRTYFNPLINLPEYFFLLKLNLHPYLFSFICLFDSAVLLFLVYKIAEDFFSNDCVLSENIPPTHIRNVTNNLQGKSLYVFAIFFSVIYICFSPLMLQQTSFNANDTKIAVFILLAFLIFKKNIFLDSSRKRNTLIFLSGFIIGLATGFKLTACIYAISFVLIMLIFLKKINNPFKTIALFCVGFIPAFLLVDGFWLIKVYKVFHNPFFPCFNNIFKSEFAEPISLLNQQFVHLKPQTAMEFIFFPFFKCQEDVRLFGTDCSYWDVRYALNFILSVFAVLLALLSKYFSKVQSYIENFLNFNVLLTFVSFCILPLYINLIIFGDYRYIIASSSLFGILLFTFITFFCKLLKHQKILTTIFCFVFLTYVYLSQEYGILHFIKNEEGNETAQYTKVLSINDLKFKDNSVILLLSGGTSAAVVNQNPNVKCIGVMMPAEMQEREENFLKNNDIWYKTKDMKSAYSEKLISDIISSDKNIYVLYSKWELFTKERLLYLDKNNQRTFENCSYINMKIFNTSYSKTDLIKCEFNIKNNQ